MVKPIIEFVCSGNHGRSEPCRIIAQYALQQRGLEREFEAASSGTLVDAIANDTISPLDKVRFIQMALERRDIYTPREASRLYTAIEMNDIATVNELYPTCDKAFTFEEDEWRDEWLRSFNLRTDSGFSFKQTKDQTRANPDVIAIFSMSPFNQRGVADIYRTTRYDPIIDILPVFVTGDQDACIKNAYGTDRETYLAMTSQLESLVPRAIDMLLR